MAGRLFVHRRRRLAGRRPHPGFDHPEAELTGLSFLDGGYHRIAMCASQGSGAYMIYRDDLEIAAIAPATLFEPLDNPYGEVIPPEWPEVLAEVAWGCNDAAGDPFVDRITRNALDRFLLR